MSDQCHGGNRSTQHEALPPQCLQSPPSLAPRRGLGSMLLGTGRGKGLCCSALLASVRLGEQAWLLWAKGPLSRGCTSFWPPLAQPFLPGGLPSSCSG